MSYYLILACNLDAPRVTIDPPHSTHVVNVEAKVILHCIAEGLPVPTIQWYKNNIPISQQSSELYLVSTDSPGTTVYTCVGKNNAGNMENTASANITVIVKGIKYFF